jgi:hypothetical protein
MVFLVRTEFWLHVNCMRSLAHSAAVAWETRTRDQTRGRLKPLLIRGRALLLTAYWC